MTAQHSRHYGPPRRNAPYLRAQLVASGWKMVDLAYWLGVSRQYLATVINDEQRARHWELALCALPRLTRQEMAALAAQRRAASHDRQRQRPPPPSAPGMRYHGILLPGSVVVVAASHVGELADEGEEGVVQAVRCHAMTESYLVAFASGAADWFAPDDVDALLAETGRTVPLTAAAR